MSRTGGCQRGAVRFRVDVALHKPGVCHCRMCQKATGGLFGAFDDPSGIAPVFQIGVESKLPFADSLAELPGRTPDEEARLAPYYAHVVSYQHPDHDTEVWPPRA